MLRAVIFCAVAIVAALGCRRGVIPPAPAPESSLGARNRCPVAYWDRGSETTFYVESDAHHLSAVRFDGIVLWTRDLYSDAKGVLWKRELPPDEAELDRLLRGDVKDRKIVSVSRADGPDRHKIYLGIDLTPNAGPLRLRVLPLMNTPWASGRQASCAA
jgi:hypothetical protein